MDDTNTVFRVFLALAVMYLLLGSTSMIDIASGAEGNDTITISINITGKTMVDINPSSLTWNGSNIYPGSVADNTTEANNYGNIWIENIGSTNITKIWFNNSYPLERPFGSGDPDVYDPANFVVIANTSSSSPYFINRVEYRENDSMYISIPNTASASAPEDMFGRFRNNSYEYFFIVEGTNGNNCTEGTLRYSTDPHTKDSTGDTNLADNTGYVLQSVNDWSVTNVTFGSETYCFAVHYDCSKAMFHKWNADAPGAGTGLCSNVPSYFDSSPLVPGDLAKAWIKAYIPYGVPYWSTLGGASGGTLTVFVDVS